MSPHISMKVSKPMHYAVVAALMISLVTSCLLGILLTQAVFGQGLNYFKELKSQTAVQKSRAASATLAIDAEPITIPEVPRAPILNDIRVNIGALTIHWTDVPDENYYNIERLDSRDGVRDWKVIATPPACDPTQVDICSPWLDDDTAEVSAMEYPDYTYSYRVIAVNKFGESAPSNELTIVPFYDNQAPDAPINFKILSQECKIYNGAYRTLITYSWDQVYGDNPEKGAIGGIWYQLYKSTSPNSLGYEYGGRSNEVTTWIDYVPSSTKSQTYYRSIRSVDANANKSVPIQTIKVEVPPCPRR